MRVALIRGTLGRSSELTNYELGPEHTVDLFVDRGPQPEAWSPYFGLHRLPALSQVTSRFGPRVRGAVELVAGSLEHLRGLEDALAGYDVAQAFELDAPVTTQAVRARRQGAVGRVVATVFENIPFKATPNRFVAARVHAAADGVDHFTAVTERARLHLQAAGVPDDRITVLPYGTDLSRFSVAQDRAPGPLRVISVARLEPAKGVEDLVVAVGLLHRRGIEVDLTLVGSGPLEGHLREVAGELGIADRLHVRAVPWEQVPETLRAADVFVLASAPTRNWREQFGFAVIEAMASGLPALVGASGSLVEVVGREDVLVAPHDPLSLADRLEQLERDPEARAALGAFNRRRALEHFDQRLARERLVEVYEQVLARPARD